MLQILYLQIILFLLYLILFCFALTRIKFFTNSNLEKPILISLFLIKVLAGLAYAWFYTLPAYHINSDSFRFYAYSLEETYILLTQPLHFFKDIFTYGYQTTGNVFVGDNSYWNDLKSNIIIKLLAVCNVFSFKNYYINIIFFNFLFFFGLIAFYRLMQNVFNVNKVILILPIFFIPSFLFWCSGIHKDGLLFSAIGMVFFYFNVCLLKGYSFKKVALVLSLLFIIFFLRSYVALLLLLAMFAWWVAQQSKKHLLSFILVYVVAIILFFISPFIHSKLNFPNYISVKQHEFSILDGGSSIIAKSIDPSFAGFLHYLPNALDMAFMQPHIFNFKNLSYIPAIIENLGMIIILIILLVKRKKKIVMPPVVYACLFFGITMLLIAGYTVTFSGAIVRYRSLVLPILVTLVFANINFESIFKNKNLFKLKK